MVFQNNCSFIRETWAPAVLGREAECVPPVVELAASSEEHGGTSQGLTS